MKIAIRTQKRINKITELIAVLRQRDITAQQAADLLSMSTGGGKSYMRELRCAEVVDVITHRSTRAGQPAPVYRLTGDDAVIDAYLAALNQCESHATPEPRSTLLERALKDPTRHVHIMHDDAHYQPTMHRFIPFRDALVAALFGAPGAHA